jgi:hypothetical protein
MVPVTTRAATPPLPIVTPANLVEVKAELDAQIERLAAKQNKLGYRFLPEDERRMTRMVQRPAVPQKTTRIGEHSRRLHVERPLTPKWSVLRKGENEHVEQ